MLVQWRAQAEFGAKYRRLVGTEVAPVAIDLVKIGKPAEKVAPIRTAMHGFEGAQGGVNVVRILIKACVQSVRIERLSDDLGLLGVHGAVQTRAASCSSNATTAPGSSMWALWPAPGISHACGACILNSRGDTIRARSPRASRTGTDARAAREAKCAPPTAKVR